MLRFNLDFETACVTAIRRRLVRAQVQASAHSLDPFLSALRSGFTVIFLTSDVFWNLAQEALPAFCRRRPSASTNPSNRSRPFACVSLGNGSIPVERRERHRRAPLREAYFLFCQRMPRVFLLVFVLVSAAIDDKNCLKFK